MKDMRLCCLMILFKCKKKKWNLLRPAETELNGSLQNKMKLVN